MRRRDFLGMPVALGGVAAMTGAGVTNAMAVTGRPNAAAATVPRWRLEPGGGRRRDQISFRAALWFRILKPSGQPLTEILRLQARR